MPVVTFACDLCGALGRADAPGPAQCATCGWVALVEAPAMGAPDMPVTPLAESITVERDPFAAATLRTAPRADAPGERVDFVLDDEVLETRTPQPEALPQLWSPPGRHDATNPGTIPVPGRRRTRPRRRLLVPALSLAAGAALAAGGALVLRGGSADEDDARDAAAEVAPPPRVHRRVPRAPAREVVPPAVPVPAALDDERPRVAAPVPIPAAAAPSEHAVASVRSPRTPAASVHEKSVREESFAHRALEARNPAPVDRQCVPRALRARRDLSGRLDGEIKARFPVTASGEIGRIEVLGDGMDPDVAAAVEEAIRSCPFAPGADSEGRPTPLSVVMKIRFAVR